MIVYLRVRIVSGSAVWCPSYSARRVRAVSDSDRRVQVQVRTCREIGSAAKHHRGLAPMCERFGLGCVLRCHAAQIRTVCVASVNDIPEQLLASCVWAFIHASLCDYFWLVHYPRLSGRANRSYIAGVQASISRPLLRRLRPLPQRCR